MLKYSPKLLNYPYLRIAMGQVAIVTQSYKNDYNECRLLCESIDRFAPDMDHFIFVNDEDVKLFQTMNYGRHKVFGKATILPWYMIRFPWKIMGHHFHISPVTIPVREWIIQQLCKLGVFEVIGSEYDAVFNVDSETVLMKPLDMSQWVHDGKYFLYRAYRPDEPNHAEFINVTKRLLNCNGNSDNLLDRYSYMSAMQCFERTNLQNLLDRIKKRSVFRSWKHILANTYRFSEYYAYGVFTNNELGMANHFPIDYRPCPVIDIAEYPDIQSFNDELNSKLSDPRIAGVCLQKKDRKRLSGKYPEFSMLEHSIRQHWDNA